MKLYNNNLREELAISHEITFFIFLADMKCMSLVILFILIVDVLNRFFGVMIVSD